MTPARGKPAPQAPATAVAVLALLAAATPASAAFISEVWLPGARDRAGPAVEVAGLTQGGPDRLQLLITDAFFPDRRPLDTVTIDVAKPGASSPAPRPQRPTRTSVHLTAQATQGSTNPWPIEPHETVDRLPLGDADLNANRQQRSLLLISGPQTFQPPLPPSLDSPGAEAILADATLHDAVTFGPRDTLDSALIGRDFAEVAASLLDPVTGEPREPIVRAGPGDALLQPVHRETGPTGRFAAGAPDARGRIADRVRGLRYTLNPGFRNDLEPPVAFPSPATLALLAAGALPLASRRRRHG